MFGIFEDDFLNFPRWDMLISWRVCFWRWMLLFMDWWSGFEGNSYTFPSLRGRWVCDPQTFPRSNLLAGQAGRKQDAWGSLYTCIYIYTYIWFIHIYIYTWSPNDLHFWRPIPLKQGLFQHKTRGHLGSRHIFSTLLGGGFKHCDIYFHPETWGKIHITGRAFFLKWVAQPPNSERFLYLCVYLEDRKVGSEIYILMPGLQSSKDLSNVIRHTGLQLFNKMLTNWNEWNHLEKLQIRYPNLEKFRGRQDFPAPKRTPGYLHKGNGIMHVVSPSSAFPMSPLDGRLIAVSIVKVKQSPGEQIQVKQR